MAQPVKDIPGFYWDKDKGKYFAIQSQGPAGSAYSAQDVKRRKLRDNREVTVADERKRQAGRIRRRIQEDPLAGGILNREHGYGNCFEPARIYASGLVRSGYMVQCDYMVFNPSSIFNVSCQLEPGSSTVNIRRVFDTESLRFDLGEDSAEGNFEIWPTNIDKITQFHTFGVPTSVCESEDKRSFAFTWLSGATNSGIFTGITALGRSSNLDREHPAMVMGPGFSRGSDVSMFCSTPAPLLSSLRFVFGSSHGILSLNNNLVLTWLTPSPKDDLRVVDDVFALSFLTDNPTILLSGGRKGILTLSDLRAPITIFGADKITHPSTITHIQPLNAHQIIVAGLNSSLCQYDLRYRKDEFAISLTHRKSKSRQNPEPTRSILRYPAYQNSANWQIGFDVDLESGIVAAVSRAIFFPSDIFGYPSTLLTTLQIAKIPWLTPCVFVKAQEPDEFHPYVQLFSLRGGHTLSSPFVSEKFGGYGEQIPVKCLRWAKDSDSGIKSLYVGQGAFVQRYAWGEGALEHSHGENGLTIPR
ncbi:hypothetical protein LZ554_002821 [Drepanopeziza brunnea f. sp. 'monogermtubi']|nr:hypothetical protein LZ554_002821 [Drepanopeziza brunnea f. sp. 'monogermtubi']